MGKYIAKRLGYMVVVALILSLLMFLVYTMIPYDRAVVEVDSYKASLKNNPNAGELYEKKLAEKRHELGTDQNVFIRYLGWVGVAPINGKYQGILQGDFGWSYKYSRPAYDVLKAPMKNTIFINIFATILGLGITIPLGIFCAVHRGSKRDTAVQVGTIVGYSIPVFITSIVFIWLFAIILGWFPVSGMKTPGSDYTGMKKFLDELYYMALPLIVMTFTSLGGMTRYVRASMSEALSLDCIRTARAKGCSEKRVIWKHALKNASLPIITLLLTGFASILGGSVIVESIFTIPGIGTYMLDAINAKDVPVVMTCALLLAFIFMIVMVLMDIFFALIDPKLRARYKA